MEQKIVITTPVFYQETAFSTLYQLLSYEPTLEAWHVQNVVMGCESPMIKNIDLSRISHNIERFNTVQPEDLTAEVTENTKAMMYLEGLGIDTFGLMFGIQKVDDWSKFAEETTVEVEEEPVLV